MSSSRIVPLRTSRLVALTALGLALSSGVASAHVAVVRNEAKLRGNDRVAIQPTTGGQPGQAVRVKTQRGVGMSTRNYGNKTVISFDKPVHSAGAYFLASGTAPVNASIQAYDKSGRQLQLFDEGTRKLRVAQWTTVRPNGKTVRSFMGVRSCCACIKQIVMTTPQKPVDVAVYTRQPTPVTPRPRLAAASPQPLPYRPLVAEAPPVVPIVTPPPAAVIPPVPIPVAAGGGGGPNFLPLIIPALLALGGGGGGDRTIIPEVTPPIPSLPPDIPVIPEPSAFALALPGLLPLLALRRRGRKKADAVSEE
ncbi:MAG: hypothetical protein KY468_18500 [Armatimonadetes bacterium]|nr:hypothetical protein [Armatimonadota bacterium]